MSVSLKLGLVPSYRFSWSSWADEMRTAMLSALAEQPSVQAIVPTEEISPHGAVQNLDQAEAVAELFRREKVDGIVLCPVDFGDERSAAKVVERVGVPALLLATKEPPARTDKSLARVSDSYCGTLSIASGLHRRKLPFHFAGVYFPSDAEFLLQLDTFARAISVVRGLLNARLGQIGVRPSAFETVSYDEGALIRKFGQNVIFANLADIVAEAKGLPDDDPRVLEMVEVIRNSVARVTVGEDYLLGAAKLELAMAGFYERAGLSAMAAQCWPAIQREMGISVCSTFGRLSERGMLTACEADILGAVSMLASHRAALGAIIPHFIDWTIQHREDDDLLLTWHCGNAPACLARSPEETALRSRSDMCGEGPIKPGDPQAGLYQFQLRSGPVTFCRLNEMDGEWKMLIARGEIEPSDEVHPGTWSWVRVRNHARLYRTLVEEGFIHHASMIHGDQAAALELACGFLGITPVIVD